MTGHGPASGLIIDEASVHYGTTVALDRFSLRAAKGEVVAILGASGSGKSTLLRAVAGLEPLTGGRIELDGRDLAGVPTHRRGLGLMFQDHGLFPHLSVADNIGYGLRIAGLPAAERQRRVAELLELIGLPGYGRRSPDALSGGEAQRVALARALAPEPGLLMLDEPLGSLDRGLRDQLTGELRRLLTGLGQTALHVTHDQGEAFAVADRVAVVADGRPVVIAPPAELWADPGTRFVAEFLGHPNIVTVTVEADGSVLWTDHRLGRLPADHPVRRAGTGPRTVVLPITAVDVGHEEPGSGHDRMPVTVVDTVFDRGLTDVLVVPDGADRSSSGLRFSTAKPVRQGAAVSIVVDVDALRPLADDERPVG